MLKSSRGTPRPLARRLAGAFAVAAGAVALVAVVPDQAPPAAAAPVAARAISCDTATGGTKFYPGDDSSRTYNNNFRNSTTINHWLQDYVPQGLTYWANWKGTQDVWLVSMHHRNENSNYSLLYAMTTGGTRLGTVLLPKGAHAGSVKIYRNWMYVQQNNDMIRRYSLSTLRTKLSQSGKPYLGAGTAINIGAIDVSFFDIAGGYLYAGHFNQDSRDWMIRYRINSETGALSRNTRTDTWGGANDRVQVPTKTQGVFVTGDTYYFSTSYGRNSRSNIYVVRARYTTNIESTTYRCFRAPTMSQDLEYVGGRLHVIYESGAAVFDGNYPWTTADNKIKNLHSASLASLRDMVW